MSDNQTALTVGIVAVIGAVSALAVAVLKYVKKSDCCMIHIITRTPTEEHPQIIIAPPPSPATLHKNKIEEHIKEIEV